MSDAGDDAEVPKDAERAILAALRTATGPMSAESIATAIHVPEAKVRRTLGRLASGREVARAGGGKFTIARHRRSG